MNHDVFISYSSEDKRTADMTCAALEARGLRCWIAPRDIVPGAAWGPSIVDGIAAAKAFVLLLSANANSSDEIPREVERAANAGLRIIPVRIEDVRPAKKLEYFLSETQWLDATTPPLERHLAYLAENVLRPLIDGRTAPAAPIAEPAVPAPPMDRRVVIGGSTADIEHASSQANVRSNLVSPRSPDIKPASRWWSEVTVRGKRYRVWAGESGIEMGPSKDLHAPLDRAPSRTTLVVDPEGRAAAWLRDGVFKLTWLNIFEESCDPWSWVAPRQKDLADGRLLALSMYGPAGVIAVVSCRKGTLTVRVAPSASEVIELKKLSAGRSRGAIIRKGKNAILIDADKGTPSSNDLLLGLEEVECIDEANTTRGWIRAAVGLSGGNRVLVMKAGNHERTERITLECGAPQGLAVVRNSNASDVVLLYADGKAFRFSYGEGCPS